MEDLLGKALHTLRIEKGISLRQAAEDVGISHTELRRIETGTRKKVPPAVVHSLVVRYGLTHVSPVIIDGKKYRIHELIKANHESEETVTAPRVSESILEGLVLNIISEWLKPTKWIVQRNVRVNDSTILDFAANNTVTNEKWGFEFLSGYRFSKKKVSDVYFRLLLMAGDYNKMSVVTNHPVIFNSFLAYPAVNFSFTFSVILIDIQKNIIVKEQVIEPNKEKALK